MLSSRLEVELQADDLFLGTWKVRTVYKPGEQMSMIKKFTGYKIEMIDGVGVELGTQKYTQSYIVSLWRNIVNK